jgi:hypothetical protein
VRDSGVFGESRVPGPISIDPSVWGLKPAPKVNAKKVLVQYSHLAISVKPELPISALSKVHKRTPVHLCALP